MSYSSGCFPGRPAAFNVTETWLAGMTQPQLAQLYASLIAARVQLSSGAKVVQAAYSQGDGSKSVTFNVTSRVQLEQDISMVQKALGMRGMSRRPMRPVFL